MWDLLVIGLVITLEPLPNVAFILLLSTKQGARKGMAFIVAWVISLLAIVVGTLLVTGGDAPRAHSVPGRGVSAATLAIGLALLAVGGWRRHRRRAARPVKPPPSWMGRLDSASPWAAAGLGFLLQPWPFVAAGAVSVAQADTSSAASLAYLVAFCVLSTASLLIMEGYTLLAPARAEAGLNALREWVTGHRDPVVTVLALVAGTALTAKGAYQLAH